MTDPTTVPPETWKTSIQRSRAQSARGESVPMETVLKSIDESMAELAAKHRQSKATAIR